MKFEKRIRYFGQSPDDADNYELFISASGSKEEIQKVKDELDKKLFRTEIKNSTLYAKFIGEYLAVLNKERWLDKEGWK